MDKLIAITEKLLITHDHAVLPGLGGFFVQMQSAEIKDFKIVSPFATISFNSMVQHNDGFLALELVRSTGITYKEASNLIEKEIEYFLKRLKTEKHIQFGKIGTFTLGENNIPVFSPAPKPAFLPANLGMKDVYFHPKQENNFKFKPVYQSIWKYAAVITLIFTIFFANNLNDAGLTGKAGLNPVKMVLDVAQPVVSSPAPKENTSTEEIIPGDENTQMYQVVIAVFESERTATKYKDQLFQENFSEVSVSNTNSNSRVVLRSFPTKEEALNYAKEIREKDTRFEDAWVAEK
jgi:hypothetical protein